MTAKITRELDRVTPSLNRIARDLRDVPAGAFKTWRDVTPKSTGNARRRTQLRGDTIQANYQYAVPLDRGSSSQAPQGMARPTLRWLQQTLRRIMRK
jgi:hypothetical protein